MSSESKYRVVLPVEIDGRVYEFGAIVELTVDQAKEYSHALMACEDEAEE